MELPTNQFDWRVPVRGFELVTEVVYRTSGLKMKNESFTTSELKSMNQQNPESSQRKGIVVKSPQHGYYDIHPMIDELFPASQKKTKNLPAYLQFAAIQDNEKEILNFANRNGNLLKPPQAISWSGLSKTDLEARTLFYLDSAEPLSLWETQSAQMASLVRFWKTTQELELTSAPVQEAISALEPFITFDNHGFEAFLKIGGPIKCPRELEYSENNLPKKPVVLALHLLIKHINAKLQNKVIYELRYDSNKLKSWVFTKPVDLLSALWLQFANDISCDAKTRFCSECNRIFRVSPAEKNPRKFCDKRCLERDRRQRNAAALNKLD